MSDFSKLDDAIEIAIARGFKETREKKKAARQMPNQNEAAQTVGRDLRDKPLGPLFGKVEQLAEVAADLRDDRRRLLAIGCHARAEAWKKLANRFNATDGAS